MKTIDYIRICETDYYETVKCILEHPEFLKRKNYKHHGETSVYDHSLAVSYTSYRICRFFGLDKKSAAIGGLLHDFYYKPWQENTEKKPLFKKHGFVHAKEALENSKKYFPELMNEKSENIIKRHMFPLNIVPPQYKESWVVTMADKYVSLEVFKEPKKLLMYIGIKKRIR